MIKKIKFENMKHQIEHLFPDLKEFFSENQTIELFLSENNIISSGQIEDGGNLKSNQVGKSLILHSIRYVLNNSLNNSIIISKSNEIINKKHLNDNKFIFTFHVILFFENGYILKRELNFSEKDNEFKSGNHFFKKEGETEFKEIKDKNEVGKIICSTFENWPKRYGVDGFDFQKKTLKISKSANITPDEYLHMLDKEQKGSHSSDHFFRFNKYLSTSKHYKNTIINSIFKIKHILPLEELEKIRKMVKTNNDEISNNNELLKKAKKIKIDENNVVDKEIMDMIKSGLLELKKLSLELSELSVSNLNEESLSKQQNDYTNETKYLIDAIEISFFDELKTLKKLMATKNTSSSAEIILNIMNDGEILKKLEEDMKKEKEDLDYIFDDLKIKVALIEVETRGILEKMNLNDDGSEYNERLLNTLCDIFRHADDKNYPLLIIDTIEDQINDSKIIKNMSKKITEIIVENKIEQTFFTTSTEEMSRNLKLNFKEKNINYNIFQINDLEFKNIQDKDFIKKTQY